MNEEQLREILLKELGGVSVVHIDGAAIAESLIPAILALHQPAVVEARIDENQAYLDNILAYETHKPQPGELTAASFGRAGAGIVESAYKTSFEDRIAQLKSAKEGR